MKAPTLAHGTRLVIEQDADTWDKDGGQSLSFTVLDPGYVVMRTKRWAFESGADIEQIVTAMRRALAMADEVAGPVAESAQRVEARR